MSSTSHEPVRRTGAEHMRDEEHCTTLTAVVRSKVLEVARNGFAGATAGGELRSTFVPRRFTASAACDVTVVNSSVSSTPCELCHLC